MKTPTLLLALLTLPLCAHAELTEEQRRVPLEVDSPDPKLVDLLSAETQVTKDTPPTFLFTTTDDKTVPVMNSVMFYSALVKAGVPVEMHIFQNGVHGVGLAPANPQLSVWPDLLAKWMRERGYMAAASQ